MLQADMPVICSPVYRRSVDDGPQLLSAIHDPRLAVHHFPIYLMDTPQLSKVDVRAGFHKTGFRSRHQELPTETEDGDTGYVYDLKLDSKEN